jgi:hypothetical protein
MVADTAGEVYAHMSEVHHTWYEGGGGVDDYEGYDFEEEDEEDDEDEVV